MSFLDIGSFFSGFFGMVNRVQQSGIAADFPLYGGPVQSILSMVVALESMFPHGGMGIAKKAAVTAVVAAAHPTLDAPTLSTAIDGIVAALNALQAAAAKLPPS